MLLFFAIAAGVAQAQDFITKKNGEDVKARILEVNQNDVKYKRWDNLEGPTFTMSKSEILMVRYENGTNDVFTNQSSVSSNVSGSAASGDVRPGMKYREYMGYYNPRSYVAQPGDKYSPAVGGLCSWLIPGLGQMICGEVGRGFGYFGGAVGASIVMGVGSGLVAGSAYSESEGAAIAGTILMLAGSIGLLTVDICAIVDGVRVAKVKNMYERDIRDMADVSMSLEPYVASVNGMNNNVVAGASLRIRF